jgi:hypothetical protein
VSLVCLPFAFDVSFYGLPWFAVFYGLDWIATVPPTVRLTAQIFDAARGPIMFGWIAAAHPHGAAMAAFGAGRCEPSSLPISKPLCSLASYASARH